MLIFDQLRKDDPQLRFLAVIVLAGMLVLLGGLWWVQVASSRHYQRQLEIQSLRSVRIPAVRGTILDREGRALAENHPEYDIDLYLEALSRDYQIACSNNISRIRKSLNQQAALKKQQLGRDLTVQEKKSFGLTRSMIDAFNRETRYEVTSNIVADLATRLGQPLELTQQEFQEHYDKALAMPLPILTNLNAAEIARFEEESLHTPAMDLDVQSIRTYPYNSLAAHVLGYLRHTYTNEENDPRDKYNYRLADYAGASGIEKMFDSELRGTAGAKSVLVNNLGYRQGETIWSPAEAGEDVQLTIDLDIQQAAERALKINGEDRRAAVVVMDVRNGDVLAMASSPNFNPNDFVQHPAPDVWSEEMERWTNSDLQVQIDHATQGELAPGSIFKIVVGMAALEAGLNPNEILESPGEVPIPGRRPMHDTAPAGPYNFDRALARSCNYYFVTIVTNGLKSGTLDRVVALGDRLHFGERTGLLPHQEDRGRLPTLADIHSRSWRLGDTANISIGQGDVAVVPLQIAVMISAVANGGTVFYPRVVSSITDPVTDQPTQTFPAGRVHDTLGVSQRTIRIVHEAMESDVEGPEGTGKEAAVPGFNIAGKTGTAEVEVGGYKEKSAGITWFASFGPVESPRYAVVVMVVGGASGGTTCAPLAHGIYETIVKKEQKIALNHGALGTITR